MDSSDPMLWLIEALALLVAVLALRGPWDGGAWGQPPDQPGPDKAPDEG